MIRLYVQDVRACLKNKCYFAALSLALTFPDICGAVEYPSASVSERYIRWSDEYLSPLLKDAPQMPCLNGELVYNLRNVFLHQGTPSIDNNKVKEAGNQLDRFLLLLGDGSRVYSMSLFVQSPNAAVRLLLVDVTFLCDCICESTLAYYRDHKAAFNVEFNAIPQAWLFDKKSPLDQKDRDGDPLGELLLGKLNEQGRKLKIEGNLTRDLLNGISKAADSGASAPEKAKKSAQVKAKRPQAVAAPRIGEQQLRSLFGQQFKEKKYRERKEEIIRTVLSARTRVELNNHLTRLYQGEDLKVLHQRLKPLTQALPGK